MRTRTDLRAGDALRTCQRERDYWKDQAYGMEQIAKRPSPIVPRPTPQPLPLPLPQPIPQPTQGGGYVGGIWVSDRSGWCG